MPQKKKYPTGNATTIAASQRRPLVAPHPRRAPTTQHAEHVAAGEEEREQRRLLARAADRLDHACSRPAPNVGMMRRSPNPNVSSGSAAVIGNWVNDPVTCALYASVATSSGRKPSASGTAAREQPRSARAGASTTTATDGREPHSTASNGRVMKIHPTRSPATTSRRGRAGPHPGAQRGDEEEPEARA